MLQISEIVKKTEEVFDLFNKHFYQGKLTRPAITVSPDGGRGAYGWCSIHEILNANNELYREINLCAEYFDRPITEIAATLLHEMSHLYNLQHDIQDVSNNGYYHNMKFKATTEAHGLHIEKHPKYGWPVTTLAPEAEAWIICPLKESYRVGNGKSKERSYSITQASEENLERLRFEESEYFRERMKIRHRIEEKNGELKEAYGLRRADSRGLFAMKLQMYFTAFVANVKRISKLAEPVTQ